MIRVVKFNGKKEFEEYLKTAQRKLPKEIDRGLVLAAKLVERRSKAIGRSVLNSSGRSSGDTVRHINSVLIRSEKRGIGEAGARHIAVVGPTGVKGNLMGIHERGMTIKRRSRSEMRPFQALRQAAIPKGGRKLRKGVAAQLKQKVGWHEAKYPERPVLGPAVRQTANQVFRLIGRTFRAVI